MPHVVSRDGTHIAYDTRGAGAPLIFVDGALCSRAFGPSAEQAARLAKHFTVYTYDRRGRGLSTDTQPYAVEREIEDLAAMIQAAGGQAFVYGISAGSVLSLRAAAALGATMVPRLVLCEPPFSVGAEAAQSYREEKAQINALLRSDDPAEAVTLFMSQIMPPPVLEELQASAGWEVLRANAQSLAYDYDVMDDALVPVAAAKALAMPVLLIVGEDSADYKHTAVGELVKSIKEVEVATIVGASFEPTDELFTTIEHFLGVRYVEG